MVVALCFVPVSVSAEELSKNQLDPWRFELKPLYLWFLSLEGDTTMPASGGSSDATSSTNEGVLTSAFSIHFEAGKGDWTVFTDYLYAQYTADNISISSSPVQGKNELTVHLSELGVTYRLLADYWYKVELLGGVRYLYVANKFDFYSDNLDTLSAKDNLWDGFGGIRLTGYLNDSISATVRADAGGGSSDLVWNVAALVDWQYKHWGSVYAGYRAMDYKVSNEALGLNLQAKGPVVGLAFNW
ncbi:hypothetical protein [Methyloprofundus sp.]|uniref:hypothetical protein n=1 Tax=Methyloprofundus sp. TaxID=2020875 RepID=UPI003D14B9BF